MKIYWSSTAVSDLESIREYIAIDSPKSARKVSKKIKDTVSLLHNFPFSGRIGRVPETRELVISGTSYIVVYIIQGDEVLIAAVLHGRQDWPGSFEARTEGTP